MFSCFWMSGPLFASLLAQAGDPLLVNTGADAPSVNLSSFESADHMSLRPMLGWTTVL